MRSLSVFGLVFSVMFLALSSSANELNYCKNNGINDQGSKQCAEEPDWIRTVPKSISSYYFLGMGSGKNKTEANNSARQDALGQVILIVNSTISTNNEFNTVYEENSSTQDYKLMKNGYSKIKVKGETAIKNFQVKKTYFEEDRDGFTAYVLGEVPKATINEEIARMKKLREELSETSIAVVAIAVNAKPKEIYYNEELKSFLEQFYKSQGYKLVSLDIDPQQLTGDTSNALISQVKEMAGDKAKKIVFASIRLTNARVEDAKGYQFYVVEGSLTINELSGTSDEVTSVQHVTGKGISKHDFRKAFMNLEKNLVEALTGKQEDSSY